MGSLDPAKLLVILVVALIVIGPERLPGAARQLGRIWREVSRARERMLDEVRTVIPDEVGDLVRPTRNVSSFLADLTSPARPPVAPSGAAEAEAPILGAARVPLEPSITADDPSLN